MKRSLRSLVVALACGVLVAPHAATAKPPQPSGRPEAAEQPFVTAIAADLQRRFPTTADAERAGYHRYTNTDDTGAISYANGRWQSATAKDPSQLWYGRDGKLLGADFSVLLSTSPTAPHRFGVDPRRWMKFSKPHYHFIVARPTGTLYGALEAESQHPVIYLDTDPVKPRILPIPAAKLALVMADAAKDSKRAVVDAGVVRDVSQVRTFFVFPALWDLVVWVVPNPNGAFAERNPNVTPAKHAATMDTM